MALALCYTKWAFPQREGIIAKVNQTEWSAEIRYTTKGIMALGIGALCYTRKGFCARRKLRTSVKEMRFRDALGGSCKELSAWRTKKGPRTAGAETLPHRT